MTYWLLLLFDDDCLLGMHVMEIVGWPRLVLLCRFLVGLVLVCLVVFVGVDDFVELLSCWLVGVFFVVAGAHSLVIAVWMVVTFLYVVIEWLVGDLVCLGYCVGFGDGLLVAFERLVGRVIELFLLFC